MTKLVAVPLFCFLIGVLLPPEFSIKLGGLRLSGYRIVLLLGFLPWIYWLLTDRSYRFCLVDFFMIAHTVWVVLSLILNEGFVNAIESGGIYCIEVLGAYLVGRIYIRNTEQFQAFARLLFYTVLVLGAMALPEFVTGWHYLREIGGLIGRAHELPHVGPRMGLNRVFGPFDHPILYGVFCATATSMTYYILGNARISLGSILPCTAVMFATSMALSGGPLLALAMQLVLLAWENLTRGIKYRWLAVLIFALIGWFTIDLLSNRSPVVAFISYVSFSNHSAFTRVLIFEHGILEVMRHPFFGIGFAEWVRPSWMPSSVDNLWLLQAMRHGIPSVVFLLSAILYLAYKAASLKPEDIRIVLCRRAWAFTIAGLMFVGCTVAFWNSLFVWFYFLIGCGVWLITPQESKRKRINVNVPIAPRPTPLLFSN